MHNDYTHTHTNFSAAIVFDPSYLLIGTFVVALEWTTFVCTQISTVKKSLGHWKNRKGNKEVSLPWIIQKYFENGFKNPIGCSGVLSLFLTPLYIYVNSTIGFQKLFHNTIFHLRDDKWYNYFGVYLFLFRIFSCCIELYFISEYFGFLLEEEGEKDAEGKTKTK